MSNTKVERPSCEVCGNKRRRLAWSNYHYRDCPIDGWKMGGPMLVCWKCEQDG